MKHEDIQLVHRCLAGDDSAFTTLVKKYQKRVHALAWRKVGDFHIAEELAQDTFLKAYEKLGTLKNPSQFAGWIYVITNRLCIAWHRKQKPPMESLETTSGEEIEAMSYRHYEDEVRENASVEHRRERVNALLEKLPESERTVVTLHYLGEMTSKAIGEFLGVSPIMNGIVGIRLFNLVGFKNELYTSTSTGVAKSIDGGESWEQLLMNSGELTLKQSEASSFTNLLILPKLAIRWRCPLWCHIQFTHRE